ncbi:MAG: hypothetical protein M3R36_12050 [Bacteroidota bacterium]|nr:hypothetical protein [Bacteroidota bacterium]
MAKNLLKADLFFLVLIYLIFLCFALSVFGWVIDDLYIYFRYVNNFINGKGIVYNPGEFVEGFSSFSWFLLLSLFKFIHLPLELSSKIAGLVFAFLNLIMLYKICLLLNLGRMSLAACVIMMFNLPFILWSVSGFEIMLYIFLLLLCFYKVLSLKINANEIIILSILIFMISLSRPEGVLFSLAFLSFIYIISKNHKFTFKIFFLYGILFGAFLIFRYLYFEDILPNTFYAKIGHNLFGYYELRTYKNGLFYIIDFFRHNPQFILLFIFVPVTFKSLNSNKIFLFSLFLIFIQVFFVIFSGGDWMVQYRFIIPAIPFLSFALVVSLKEFMISFKIKKLLHYSIVFFIFFITGWCLIFADYKIINIETQLWNNLKHISEDIKNDIPSKSLVANGSSGIIPYYLQDIEFIDLVGLTNKHIAKNGFRHGTWFEKSLPDYVYSKNPAWIIMWKKKKEDGVYKFENASPCYSDMAQNINFNKYTLNKTYDVYDDVKIELYKLNDKTE